MGWRGPFVIGLLGEGRLDTGVYRGLRDVMGRDEEKNNRPARLIPSQSLAPQTNKGLCNNYQEAGGGGGGAKNEPPKEKYYTIPPSQQTQISSDPSKSPKNYDEPPPQHHLQI